MKNIAIVYGGNSLESDISILTALKVHKGIDEKKYNSFLIYMDHSNNFYVGDGLQHIENYSLKKDIKRCGLKVKTKFYFYSLTKRYYFDEVLVIGHGKNIEDGSVFSYFKTLGIPVIGHNEESSFLIQNKHMFNNYVHSLHIPNLKHIVVEKYEIEEDEELVKNKIMKIGLPLIIKASRLGSSISVYMVNDFDDIIPSLDKAFVFDNQVICERYISNKIEINIALLGYEKELVFSEFEIVSEDGKVLSFNDKYDYSPSNQKRKIAELKDEKLTLKIKKYSKRIFNDLNLCGVARFDYIYDVTEDKVYLNEVNSIPGSLSYYLFEKKQIPITELITKIIEYGEKKNKKERMLKTTYREEFLMRKESQMIMNKLGL